PLRGQSPALRPARARLWEGGLRVGGGARGGGGARVRDPPRLIAERPMGDGLGRNERIVVPNRLAVAPPIERKRPARQRFARIPSALAVVQNAARRKASAQPADQFVGADALGRAEGCGVPFRRLISIHPDDRRL